MAKKNNVKDEEVKVDVENKTDGLYVEPILAPENLKDNQVFIEEYGVVTIKPTKLRYFESLGKNKSSMFNNVMMLQQMGYNNVMLYKDGKEVIENALKAILDIDTIDFYDKLTTVNLNKMVKIAIEINEVKIDDFLINQKMEEGEKQKKENV